jgi:asparagine synthase (glutamine-hydrolysing)
MCGIAGIVSYKETVDAGIVKKMLARIQYRGPDESGIVIGESAVLGSVRLSIIDLISGQQPMTNDKQDLWIVYNGEVFNYIELRGNLIKSGHTFKSQSDTEVILHAYEEYGEDCLSYLNGQFAFAIWNSASGEIFLARDRVGIRPLYYSFINNHFVFASEIKSILEYPAVIPRLNMEALVQVFTFWTTLTPNTMFKGIMELPPGHYMKVSPEKNTIHKYWQLSFPANEDQYISNPDDALCELESVLMDAVKIQLRADVTVAAYLSGGIDSSATTYFIKKILGNNLKTFSIGFSEKEFDESPFQLEVSKFLSTDHVGFECSNMDIANYFPEVIWHTEIPVLRTAPVPMYCLSRKVRENNIKVVVTGEGADEFLGGYDIFKEAIIRDFWSRQPESSIRPLLLKRLYPYMPQLQNQSGKMLRFFFGYQLNETGSPFYSHILRWNNSTKISWYLKSEIQHETFTNEITGWLAKMAGTALTDWPLLSRAQWLESSIFMSGYLLSSQGDRVSMAHSVEGRYPFLDHRVIEFCSRLHPDLKIKGLNEKYILKKLMKGKIPDSVIKRPKQAYRSPVANCFLVPGAPGYVQELLSDRKIAAFGIFDETKVSCLIKKMKSTVNTELENMILAGILSTQIWYEKFIFSQKKPVVPLKNCRELTARET